MTWRSTAVTGIALLSLAFGAAGLSIANDRTRGTDALSDKNRTRQLYSGTVKSIGGDSFILEAREGVSHAFMVGRTTEYWLDDRLADRRDVLKVGVTADVTVDDDVALKISVRSR